MTDPVDADQLVLERLGHGRLDDLGRGAGVDSRDRDDRRVDVRQLAVREPRQRDQAREHDDERHHSREDGALDRVAGDSQEDAPAPAAAAAGAGEGSSFDGTASMPSPGASLLVPATTTTSPGRSPLTISTSPSCRTPSATSTGAAFC